MDTLRATQQINTQTKVGAPVLHCGAEKTYHGTFQVHAGKQACQISNVKCLLQPNPFQLQTTTCAPSGSGHNPFSTLAGKPLAETFHGGKDALETPPLKQTTLVG